MDGTFRWARVALALMVVVLPPACSSGDVDATSFEEHLVERFGLTGAEAACVSGYVYDEYAADEIQRLDRDGLTGVGPERWSGYAQALLACSFDDDLSRMTDPDDGG